MGRVGYWKFPKLKKASEKFLKGKARQGPSFVLLDGAGRCGWATE
jgi:hypothetical protein